MRLEFVKLFVNKGVNVNVHEKIWLQTPLILAIKNDDIDVVKELLNTGAKIESKDIFQKTSLDYARELKHKDIYFLLVNESYKRQNTLK